MVRDQRASADAALDRVTEGLRLVSVHFDDETAAALKRHTQQDAATLLGDLERTVARAREAGHEALLQVPMEPFDYPDSDPGPQTLLTSSRPPENLDRLSWVMSRFSGFVGIVNYMGAKLTSDPAALEPVLREIRNEMYRAGMTVESAKGERLP